jgi:hypothetical protein
MKWSPKDEQAARELKEWKQVKNQAFKKKHQNQKQIQGTTGTKTGQEYMDLDDF